MTAKSRWYSTGGFRFGRFCASMMPRRWALLVGRFLGTACHALAERARNNLEENLRNAGTANGDAREIGRKVFRRFGVMLADYFVFAAGKLGDPRRLMVKWRGFDHLLDGFGAGKGVVLVTAHLGHWELGAILLASEGIPMTVVTLPEPGSGLTKWREEYRKKLGIRTITVGEDTFAFVEIIQALRRNECVAMLVDRPYAGSGVPVKLFGKETEFSSGPALLWQHTGATVVPAFVLQTDDDQYVPMIDAPIAMQPGSCEANTQRVADAFEDIIRKNLDQWFNFVPVFKPAPAASQE